MKCHWAFEKWKPWTYHGPKCAKIFAERGAPVAEAEAPHWQLAKQAPQQVTQQDTPPVVLTIAESNAVYAKLQRVFCIAVPPPWERAAAEKASAGACELGGFG